MKRFTKSTSAPGLAALLILILVGSALVAVPQVAEAQSCSAPGTSGPSSQYRLTRNRNLRTGPGFGCSTVTTLSGGSTLTVSNPEVNNDGFIWRPVSSSGRSGWLAVRRSDGSGSVVTPISSPPPSGGCSGASPDQRFNPALARRISHPQFEARGWKVALRSGPSRDCGSSLIWANDNLAVEELGRFAGSDESWSLVRFTQNGSTGQRWAETRFLETRSGGGTPPPSGGCSGASPDQRFNPALARRISHPQFEARGWKVALRSGPSRDCGSSLIWANDNLAVEELGRFAGSDESWSLVRFTQNGSTGQRWAETRFLETRTGGGTPPPSGGCSGASPDQRFNPALARRISHPQFEARGWKVALRSGPSRDCGSSLIWANDNLAVEELGRFAGSDESWSLVRFTQNGSTGQRWAETRFLETRSGGGTPSNVRQRIVDEARKELNQYGGQHECNSAGLRSRVGRYWSAVGSSNNGCTNLEWSGVFISWVVRQAGLNDFAFDQRHWWYIHQSFRGSGPYRVIDTRGGTAQPGDLVCLNRRSSSWTYDDWRAWSSRLPARPDVSRDGVEAHCDVVESVSGGRVTGIGGNLSQTVKRETHSLTRYDVVLRLQE